MNTWKQKLDEHLALANQGVTENAHITDFRSEEAAEAFPLIRASELPHLGRSFLPLAFFGSGENGRVLPEEDPKILTTELSQTLISGATGSGKTQIFVLPLLSFYANLSQEQKPSLFIYDPKGENIRTMGEYMKQRGYKLISLDLKSPHRGSHYNPLLDLFDRHIEFLQIKDQVEKGEIDCTFAGVTYPTHAEAVSAAMERATELEVYTNQTMEEFTELLLPVHDGKDAMWVSGGRMILRGILDTMLYYGYLGIIKRKDFTLSNLAYLASNNPDTLCAWLYTCRHIPTVAATLAGQIDLRAQITRDGYLSTMRTAVGEISSPTVKILTDDNDLDLEEIASGHEPYAIFYSTNMMSRSGDAIASMLINTLINICMDKADHNNGSLPRDLIFVLDEFANMRKLPNFSTKVSLLRSYRVFMIMVVQSYAQLIQIYGEATTKIILDNAVTNFYLGSPDYDTQTHFIRSLGNQSVYQTSASIGNDGSLNFNVALKETPLLHPSDLDMLKLGECFIRVSRHCPLRSYMMPQFLRTDIQCPAFASRPLFRPNLRPMLTISGVYTEFVRRLQKDYPSMSRDDFETKYSDIPDVLSGPLPSFAASYFTQRKEIPLTEIRPIPHHSDTEDWLMGIFDEEAPSDSVEDEDTLDESNDEPESEFDRLFRSFAGVPKHTASIKDDSAKDSSPFSDDLLESRPMPGFESAFHAQMRNLRNGAIDTGALDPSGQKKKKNKSGKNGDV